MLTLFFLVASNQQAFFKKEKENISLLIFTPNFCVNTHTRASKKNISPLAREYGLCARGCGDVRHTHKMSSEYPPLPSSDPNPNPTEETQKKRTEFWHRLCDAIREHKETPRDPFEVLKGWNVCANKRAMSNNPKHFDAYYFDEEGNRYRSKPEVFKFLDSGRRMEAVDIPTTFGAYVSRHHTRAHTIRILARVGIYFFCSRACVCVYARKRERSSGGEKNEERG